MSIGNAVDERGQLAVVLELLRSWTPVALTGLAALEARVVDCDGGRLKLEWQTLRERSGDRVDDLLWWDGDRLVGFLGIYAFGSDVELSGMVDPAVRRRGVGRALLVAATELLGRRGVYAALLVTPRSGGSGAAFAAAYDAGLHHSEHALVLAGEPTDGPHDPGLRLRPAEPTDDAALRALLLAAFGWDRGPGPAPGTQAVDLDGVLVGTLRTRITDGTGDVHGFAVDPARQGRGIGRDALREACRALRAGGAARVALEVAVDNDRALGLYTSLGFRPVATEDYYLLPMGSPVNAAV